MEITRGRLDLAVPTAAIRCRYRRSCEPCGVTLVELLVVIGIMAVVSAMTIGIWLALQSSYAYSTRADHSRETARDAMSRMVREIRDAQGSGSGAPAILVAQPYEIRITTAFNDPGPTGEGRILLVRYWYDADDQVIYRQRDTSLDGSLGAGDRIDKVATHIVNGTTPSASEPTGLFDYTFVDSSGAQQTAGTVYDTASVQAVHIRIIADLDPGRSPNYIDLNSTVQPRNQRQI